MRSMLAALVVLCASPGFSATLSVDTSAVITGPGLLDEDRQDVMGTATTPNDPANLANSSTAALSNATADAMGEVDAATGTLKAKVSTSLPGAMATTGVDGTAFADTSIQESFTVSGAGSVTFFLTFDGMWSLSSAGAGPDWLTVVDLSLGSTTVNQTFDPSQSANAGTALETLEIKAFLFGSSPQTVTAGLSTRILGDTSGSIDFFSTAVLSYEADPGVTLSFADTGFLSGPATGGASVVPLPDAGWMLLTAATCFLGMRRLNVQRVS